MPQVVELPTRRKKEMPQTPTKQKRHLQSVETTHASNGVHAEVPVKKQKVQVVVPSATKTQQKSVSAPQVTSQPTRNGMRSGEMSILEGMLERVEVMDARGKRLKPPLFLSKGELEALTLGVQILHGTVKVKQ